MLEQMAVTIGVAPASLAKGVQVLELHQQDSGLKAVQTAVHPQQIVMVFLAAAMVAQHGDALGQLGVAGRDHPSVARPAQIL